MKKYTLITLIFVLILFSNSCRQEKIEWPEATQTSKPWTRWWWMDNAVDRKNLSRELREMAEAGIGGVEITPIYGVKGEDERCIEFLSPEFTEILEFTIDETEKLGMGVDLPPGSGWRCGAPFVPEEKGLWNLNVTHNEEDGSYSLQALKNRDKVKRPAKGGEGWAIDTFNKEITEWYLGEFWKRLGLEPGKLRCFFHDSFEYTGDYTTDFLNEFKNRRGYDLEDYLYVFAGDCEDDDLIARIKSDYRETLSDLVLSSFIQPMTAWANEHGSLNRNQAHGSPGNILDLYAACDIPETEFFRTIRPGDHQIFIQKFASSAAHVGGKKLVSSESFTWLNEHWTVTPTDMIRATNRFFLAGINHMFFHGTCYSPDDAPWPGWLFYASTQLNNRNPLWPELPGLFKYIERTQSILQEAEPVTDLLVYWPYHDVAASDGPIFKHLGVGAQPEWFYAQPVAELSERLLQSGFTFDYISDEQLSLCTISGDKILTPGGIEYQAVVIPETSYMPVQTLLHLSQLSSEGAIVVFDDELPKSVPGNFHWRIREEQLNTLKSTFSEDGIGIATEILQHKNTEPEKELAQNGFFHLKMKLQNDDVYLVFNLQVKPKDTWVKLGTSAQNYVFMDPMTGKITRASKVGDQIRIQLNPEQIIFVRCTNSDLKVPEHHYLETGLKKHELKGRWKLEFRDGGPVYPGNVDLVNLQSWTKIGDQETRRFAGTARYSLEFDWDGPSSAWLDLGKVLDCAAIKLNGKDFGTCYGPEFSALVDNLQQGKNKLIVEVTNVAANRIRDLDRRGVEWRRFEDINFVNIDYQPFDASGWDIRDAGLLGPVQFYFSID